MRYSGSDWNFPDAVSSNRKLRSDPGLVLRPEVDNEAAVAFSVGSIEYPLRVESTVRWFLKIV
jgi:hypothetical protein